MEDSLKRTLKVLKEREAMLSMLLGAALVILLIFISSIYGFKYFTKNDYQASDLEIAQTITYLAPTQKVELTKNYVRQIPLQNSPTPLLMFSDSSKQIGQAIKGLTVTLVEHQQNSLRTYWQKFTQGRARVSGGQITDTSIATSSAEIVMAQNTKSEHIVVPGDNLWKIAEKYSGNGFNYIMIAKYNGLTDPSLIMPGDHLELPSFENNQPISTNQSISSVVVNKGDSLWVIAQKVYGDGDRYPEIVKANLNLIKKPSVIEPGWILVIPRT